jgi:phosphohistidine phosphatase
MAERLASLIAAPDLLISSPADRAIETARLFAARLGVPSSKIVLQERLYGGLLAEEFLRLIHALDDQHQSVLVFGHDPSFSEFAAMMVPRFKDMIPKAGYLIMDLPRRSWSAVRAGDGRAVAFERPPTPDVQKRMEAPENTDVVKVVARAAARVTRAVRPYAVAARSRTEAARAPKRVRTARRPQRAKKKTVARKRRGTRA